VKTLLDLSNNILFFYYLLSNLIYLILLTTAIIRNTVHRHRLASLGLEHLKSSPFTPPISVLVPAHNEEKSIVSSVISLLKLDYPGLEIIVVNDGSDDSTLAQLQNAYALRLSRLLYVPDIPTAPFALSTAVPQKPVCWSLISNRAEAKPMP
jgi:cellulose synthase/poly-beta-1,6-N-acetylglucosamine synthase-like glycosyltransferase